MKISTLIICCILLSCKSNQSNWYLITNSDQSSKYVPFGYTSGYVNAKGDTVIPLDKFVCFTDTVKHYAIVLAKNQGLIGINKKEEKLFNAVWNGEGIPINETNGMIMIKENEKYGFANQKGEIIIKPTYMCAQKFWNGQAKVSYNCFKSKDEHTLWDSNDWFLIDKKGNRIDSK